MQHLPYRLGQQIGIGFLGVKTTLSTLEIIICVVKNTQFFLYRNRVKFVCLILVHAGFGLWNTVFFFS